MKNLTNQVDSIFEAQEWLRALHFEPGWELTLVNPDGIYGEATESAVREFQLQSGLEATGELDFASHRALYEAYKLTQIEGERLEVFPREKGYVAKVGERSELVEITQLVLRALADEYDGLSGREPSGLFDEVTESELREVQRIHGLEQSGELDLATWNELARAFARLKRY